MRMDSTLNVTPEGSLSDLPATVGGVEETREGTHHISEERPPKGGPSSNIITSTEETPETFLTVATERNLTQVESPRRIQRTREASREDAIASTRQFFASVSKQNRATMTELPIDAPTDISGRNTMNLNISVTSTIPIVTEAETTEAKTRTSRTFLPNRSPSRPTTTTTCRPQMWVQHVLEGQINEPSQEGADSAGSSPSEPYVLAEGILEELGCEWRALHPFKIPGVRFPTDNNPPNQRRLAENDALVELIQTTEYLEDTPTWGQRDYRLYPPRYGDSFYRGRGRGRGRDRGRRDWLSERPLERESNGGFGRGFSHGNRRGIRGELHQAMSERDQRDRQEEEWSILARVERRDDSLVG